MAEEETSTSDDQGRHRGREHQQQDQRHEPLGQVALQQLAGSSDRRRACRPPSDGRRRTRGSGRREVGREGDDEREERGDDRRLPITFSFLIA